MQKLSSSHVSISIKKVMRNRSRVLNVNPLTVVVMIVVFFIILAALDYFAITLISLITTLLMGSSSSPRYLYTGVLTRLTDPVGLSVTILVIMVSAMITYALFSGWIKRNKTGKS